MNANLQKAIDTLHIQDVYLRDLKAGSADGFDPKYAAEIETLQVQTMHAIKEAQVVEQDQENVRLLRVFVALGVRWVDTGVTDEETSVRALIEAEFVAEYAMDELLEKGCIDAFALRNVSYHVWPYWRELLMSQCWRMRLPRLMLPAVQFAHNRDQETTPLDQTDSLGSKH